MCKFSIIIPVRCINEYLKENIECIKGLEYKDFEVLIVTDTQIKYDFEGDDRFRILTSGSVGPADKRNLGARHSKGEILAFLDDDAFPRSDWLTRANEIFEENDVFAIGAPGMTPLDAGFLERMSGRVLESWLTGANTVYRHVPQSRRFVDDYPTVNLFIRKRHFLMVGGFDTEFWPGEDTKLCLELVKLFGVNFIYDPEPVVYHHRRELFIPHLVQVSRYGRHRGQFARIFPETSRRPAYFVPTLFVIGLLFGPLLGFVSSFFWDIYFSVLVVYQILLFLEGVKALIKDKSFVAFVYVVVGIFLTHIVYGINFLIGFLKRPALQLRNVDSKSGDYLGG